MTPIGELRASILVGLAVYNLDWILVYLISVIGNLIPVVLLLLFFEPVSNQLSKRFKIFQRFFLWLFKRTRKKYDSKMEKYGYPDLAVFVAIPLPITGGWTGSLIAFLFGIPFKKAFPLITLGIMTAGIIVVLVTQAGIVIGEHFGWQVLIGLLLTICFIFIIHHKIKK